MVTFKKTTLVLLILLSIFFFRGLYMNEYHSVTSDEPVIYTGLALWKTGDFAHSPSHPPGMKLLTAWFTLPLNPEVPIPQGFPDIDEFAYGRYLIFQYNQQMFQDMINWGRFPALLLGLLGALYVYWWAREVTNKKAALFATALYTFFPLIIGLSAVADNDIMVSTFFIMTLYYFKHYIESGTTRDAVLVGICLGIALLSKHTGILLIPILMLAGICLFFTQQPIPMLKRWRKEGQLTKKGKFWAFVAFFVLIGVVSCFVLNAGYLFQGTFTPLGDYNFERESFSAFNSPAVSWIPMPVPYWYLKGFEGNQIFSIGTHFFRGEWLTTEDWYFFVFSFLVKTPLAFLIMLAIFAWKFPKLKQGRGLDILLILLTAVGVTLLFSIKQYKLGLRHLLPIIPPLFILTAMLWQYAQDHSKVLKRTLWVLFAWFMIASVLVHPFYLGYFNELIGGSQNGYKYFIDSNVDWGQDLNAVKKWMDKNNVPEIGLSYFGHDIPKLRGINARTIPCERTPGLHVVSVNNLQGLIFTGQPKDCYKWLRDVPPSDQIGYSMLVYNIPQ